MTVLRDAAELAVLLGTLSAISLERARAYGVRLWPLAPWAAAFGLCAFFVGGCIAGHGALRTASLILVACAAVASATDLLSGYIFDRMLAVSAALLLPCAIADRRLEDAVLGAALFGGALLLPYLWSRGKAMGLGDIKFAAVLGFGLGSGGVLPALSCAAICGGSVAVALFAFRMVSRNTAIPFGPFLAIGACFALAGSA